MTHTLKPIYWLWLPVLIFAAQILLRTDERISKLRGDFYSYHGTKVMPTYHPAYLLRNPENKRQVWEDIQKVMAELRLSTPD